MSLILCVWPLNPWFLLQVEYCSIYIPAVGLFPFKFKECTFSVKYSSILPDDGSHTIRNMSE